jgi:hypothetical protein
MCGLLQELEGPWTARRDHYMNRGQPPTSSRFKHPRHPRCHLPRPPYELKHFHPHPHAHLTPQTIPIHLPHTHLLPWYSHA